MIIYMVAFLLIFLSGCASQREKPKTFQELMAEDQMRNDPTSRGYREMKDREFALQKQYKENTGVLTASERTSLFTAGGLDLSAYRHTHRFYVRMECERNDREFLVTTLKNKKIHWRVGSEAEGDAVSDRDGILEFSYVTTKTGTSPLVIEYQNSKYTLPITTGPMILFIPRERCGKDVEKDPSGFVGENQPDIQVIVK